MSFKLNLNNIDTNFPVPGVDNPSQGFRDNFSIIENNFIELDDITGTLNEVAVRVNSDNDFNGQGTIENAVLKSPRAVANFTMQFGTESSTSVNCNWNEAAFYLLSVDFIDENTPLVINLNNWPAAGYAKMNLMLTKNDIGDRDIIFRGKNGDSFIKQNNLTPFVQSETTTTSLAVLLPLTQIDPNNETATTEPVLIEAFTYNGGNIVYLNYVGKFE
jgi:hypothetical protein